MKSWESTAPPPFHFHFYSNQGIQSRPSATNTGHTDDSLGSRGQLSRDETQLSTQSPIVRTVPTTKETDNEKKFTETSRWRDLARCKGPQRSSVSFYFRGLTKLYLGFASRAGVGDKQLVHRERPCSVLSFLLNLCLWPSRTVPFLWSP